MSLSYRKASKSPYVFLQLTGLTVREFEKIVEKVRPGWELLENQKQCSGRPSHLPTLEDKLLCTLMYYRTYITHTFLGYLFNMHNANICRLLKKMEPLLAKQISIQKDRKMTPEKMLTLLADVTEQAIQRPQKQKKQKASYSGKKKSHTMKTELIVEAQSGKILSVSKSYRGRIHDFRIRKQEKLLPRSSIKCADSGYQGWQKLQRNVLIPHKRYRKKPLTEEQKIHNSKLASMRKKIEHKIRELKIFKLLSYVYRNLQKKYHMRFNIIAGIVNIKNGA